ncbi:MAG: hypothetical protein ABII12_09660, partial [Planctomycetota bacterium]
LLLADVNEDSEIDGNDIQCFVECMISGTAPGCNCACADLAEPIGSLDMADVSAFIDALLNS